MQGLSAVHQHPLAMDRVYFFLKLDSWEGREKYHVFTNSSLLSSRWTAKCVKKVELCD